MLGTVRRVGTTPPTFLLAHRLHLTAQEPRNRGYQILIRADARIRHPSIRVQDRPWSDSLRCICSQKATVIAVTHKAEILALVFGRHLDFWNVFRPMRSYSRKPISYSSLSARRMYQNSTCPPSATMRHLEVFC